jgi:Zn-finger nucleic acid-binding protein
MPRCPICFVPMARSEEDNIRVHTCPSCFGHWIPSVALQRRVRFDVDNATAQAQPSNPSDPQTLSPSDPSPPLDIQSTSLADLAAVVTEADSKKPLRCPECEKFMAKERYQQMIPVNIDRCRHCNRLWLDTGEYSLIRRLYVELAISTDPQIVHLREKVATATMEFDTRATLTQTIAHDANALAHPGGGGLANLTLNAIFDMLK